MNEESGGTVPADRSAVDGDEAAYRGFLFADLRGYTAFVERHGDSAGADLLDAYRELVRAEVARHAGAEIRTEGDSFYVVFPSAGRAVACGLAIVEAATKASLEHPDRPIRVGIGINAGETIQRAEGFVGTAVNLAARVCSQAGEGEVLVTGAVRDVVGATPDLQFVPRGSRRLKGIARSVPLFAVRRGAPLPAARTGPVPGRRLAIGAALVAVPALVAGLWIADARDRPATETSAPAARSTASPDAASAAPSPSAQASQSPDDVALDELLAMVGEEIAPECEPADEDDRPVLIIDPATAQTYGITPEDRAGALTGITCEIQSTAAPDAFHLWRTRYVIDYSSVDVGEALILNRAGRLGIPRADCTDGGPAVERWEVGDLGGWFLCNELFGDAIIEWSYDDHALFGRAVRRDGNLASLLQWWTAEARLLAP